MLKKRLIFTLLWNNGSFMLSRNFRLQKVGDVNWLNKNYNFSSIAESIDELVILNVSRGEFDPARFGEDVAAVTRGCFVPFALGGQLRTLEDAARMMHVGADKLVVNSALYYDPDFVRELSRVYGKQCVVASIDFKRGEKGFAAYVDNGEAVVEKPLERYIEEVSALGIGELYLNSMQKDGTGQGYVMDVLEQVPDSVGQPVIMAGGAGNAKHFLEGFSSKLVDAVATANLFNFVGDGLPRARQDLLDAGVDLARW